MNQETIKKAAKKYLENPKFDNNVRNKIAEDAFIAGANLYYGGNNCVHPWSSVLGDGEMKPARCLACGKYL